MQSISKQQFKAWVKAFDFSELFNQLGWDYVDDEIYKKVGDETFTFNHVANKEGFAILVVEPDKNGQIPAAAVRKRVHTEISKLHHEHLLIFIDKNKSAQQWELILREPNKPIRTVGHKWNKQQDPELLYQKLAGAFFSFDEEGNLTIIDVVNRLKENFGANAEKVTKKFYAEFKTQHKAFLDFISGIDDHIKKGENKNKQWYASLMLNRLMFCYFIQKKGFLDGDRNYLSNKLEACKNLGANDQFYSFYRSFLLELFHDGLGKPEANRNHKIPVDLGKIPYLNGGLFDVHQLEKQFEAIQIADDAFEKIFEFFDKWEWHLDTREDATGKTINPDVIGYIFEKYINERAAMGAYYTKEDITEYISKNTILPFLFDETQRQYPKAFKTNAHIWQYLQASGSDYIYDAVKKGVPQEGELYSDLPDEIQEGFKPELEDKVVAETTEPHLWEIRRPWNQAAPEEIALPTETYRELIERRKRYADIAQKIHAGEIEKINDFITYNLNIRQFTQDYLETTNDADFIRHFYKAINKVTILDPTCGSGAFLFAALNILEPLYNTCLDRMEEFVTENPGKYKFFEDTLNKVNSPEHPSRTYFIYKSIILHNLFGVDIMKEAVEIAKLRLFLKLVSTVEVDYKKRNLGLEPLPDIDFNIRHGNTLVGFATEQELLNTIQKHDALFAQDKLDEFKDECDIVAKAYTQFSNCQLDDNVPIDDKAKAKNDLNAKLETLNSKLNKYLATNYGIDADKKPKDYGAWLESHMPFHWFAEFYQIIAGNGGFDVIIGNPPYIEYSKVRKQYTIVNKDEASCGNLFGIVTTKLDVLKNEHGRTGMIVPISLICTKRMSSVLEELKNNNLWLSHYAERPSKLFTGAEVLLTIYLTGETNLKKSQTYSTGFTKWNSNFRTFLFDSTTYQPNDSIFRNYVSTKSSSQVDLNIIYNLLERQEVIEKDIVSQSKFEIFYRIGGGRYWKIFTDFSPRFILNGVEGKSSRENRIFFRTDRNRFLTISALSSSLFYYYFIHTTNCRDLNPNDLRSFPLLENKIDKHIATQLSKLGDDLMRDYQRTSEFKKKTSSKTGEIEYQEFYPRKSKDIIDQIDTVLAQHYGFTEAELDFIINYDYKYRMGGALSEGGDGKEE
ncbi:hypothetical protein GC194_00470 [bacterium]|nr:hypothetical protein [bacterium]